LALVLATGFGAVWAMAVLWSAFTALEAIEPRMPSRDVVVDRHGTPLLRIQSVDNVNTTYQTFQGQEVSLEKSWTLFGVDLSVPDRESRMPLTWYRRVTVLPRGRPATVYWYLVDDGNPADAAYFVGFDAETARRIGYLGTSGFRLDEPAADDRFAIDETALVQNRVFATAAGNWSPVNPYLNQFQQFSVPGEDGPGYLLSGNRLVQFDLRARRTRVLGEFPHAMSVAMFPKWPPPKHEGWLVAVRMPEEVALIDPHTERVERFALPATLRERSFTFYQTAEREAVFVADPVVHVVGEGGRDVLRVDAEGRILSRNELRWESLWWSDGSNRAVTGSIAAAASPAPLPALGILPLVHATGDFGDDLALAWRHGFPSSWPHLLPVCVVGTIMAWLCYRRQRRLCLPWTGAWVTFVFLFGLPGLVGYLVHRRRPPVTPCDGCGQAVPRDRPACARCGREFAPPPRTGKEIFA
jgi:hypothetical protein